jgi:uncharacterized protein (DUF169 family)
MIATLKRKFGQKCLGLKVNYKEEFFYTPDKPIRFCEAINDAFKTPLLFDPTNLICHGAKRSMGLLMDDKDLIKHIAAESDIAMQTVKKALVDIPRMNTPIHNILMGIDEKMERTIRPDLYILYLSPKQVMNLMRSNTFNTNEFPVVKPFTFLSICGNVFISTFKSANMSISFGCPESRKYAGLKDNQLVVGLPYSQALQMFS